MAQLFARTSNVCGVSGIWSPAKTNPPWFGYHSGNHFIWQPTGLYHNYQHVIKMAGAAGFEPANADTKNRCLTTWLRPNGVPKHIRKYNLWPRAYLYLLTFSKHMPDRHRHADHQYHCSYNKYCELDAISPILR